MPFFQAHFATMFQPADEWLRRYDAGELCFDSSQESYGDVSWYLGEACVPEAYVRFRLERAPRGRRLRERPQREPSERHRRNAVSRPLFAGLSDDDWFASTRPRCSGRPRRRLRASAASRRRGPAPVHRTSRARRISGRRSRSTASASTLARAPGPCGPTTGSSTSAAAGGAWRASGCATSLPSRSGASTSFPRRSSC